MVFHVSHCRLARTFMCLSAMGLYRWTWPHQTADARGMFSAVDRFLRNLQTELEGSAPSYQSLPWGEELVRLAPTSILTVPDVGANDMPAASQDEPVSIGKLYINGFVLCPWIHLDAVPAHSSQRAPGYRN
jgi:hypothetical protein